MVAEKRAAAAAPTTAGGSKKPSRPPTAYETKLYALCSLIPRGKVTTYGAMAAALGSSPRAVGQALRRNPYAPRVPCHRIIAATLELGGFSGSWGVGCASVEKKRSLLEAEGVRFTPAGELVNTKAVLSAADLSKLLHAK